MTVIPALQSPPFSATDALREAVSALQGARVESASLDARLLLQHVLGVTRERLLADADSILTAQQAAEYRALVERRARREPVAQLLGRREFWGMELMVTAATLDPRPDSETLIEAVLEARGNREAALSILDLGTGTGCLLLALLSEYPQSRGTGVDISDAALEVAERNAQALGFSQRVRFVRSDWAEKLEGRFELVISNPPYIPAAEIATLAPEVRCFEPLGALDGGADGLDCYRALALALPGLLADGGLVALEIGAGQEHIVSAMMAGRGLRVTKIRQDLAGIARCILLEQ